jgi:hypothetical protein
MKIFVRFCGCISVKLASDVRYAIVRFVFFNRKRKSIPLKKNSSVNASKKLRVPAATSTSADTPLIYFITNVTMSIIGKKSIKKKQLFFSPFFLIPYRSPCNGDVSRFMSKNAPRGRRMKRRTLTAI